MKDRPFCCNAPMTRVRAGYRAGFEVCLWRCLGCEAHETTAIRVDGKTFWVGAMARAIRAEELRIVADAYGRGATPPAA